MKMITKTTKNLNDYDFDAGVLILINKPLKWTSFKVVDRVKRLLKARKVGHAGTLDPQATGLLLLCTGKLTKSISNFQNLMKEYTGKIYLGKTTPTMDIETIDEASEEKDISHINIELIREKTKKFIGEIEQVPPSHSAIWVDGKRSYKLAREGKEVNLKPRKVYVEKFEIINYTPPIVEFAVVCSKGTYVRSLARDLGEELGCGAFLYELKRVRIGEFKLEDAIEFQELKKIAEKNRQ